MLLFPKNYKGVKKMKKILAFVLMLSLLSVCLIACGNEENTDNSKPEESKEEVKVMTYAEYIAAEADAKVVVEAYVQDKQGWWMKDGVGVATVYTQDRDGAYFFYNLPCSEEDYAKLTQGKKIRVTGYKTLWDGEIEITDGVLEILDNGDTYVAPAFDVTALLGTEDLCKHINEFAAFKEMTVVASKDADGNDAAFIYNWDGSGSQGDDVYFTASIDGKTQTFVIESYLRGKDTDVYKAAEALKVGDKIDVEAFLYWYQSNAQPHVVNITVK